MISDKPKPIDLEKLNDDIKKMKGSVPHDQRLHYRLDYLYVPSPGQRYSPLYVSPEVAESFVRTLETVPELIDDYREAKYGMAQLSIAVMELLNQLNAVRAEVDHLREAKIQVEAQHAAHDHLERITKGGVDVTGYEAVINLKASLSSSESGAHSGNSSRTSSSSSDRSSATKVAGKVTGVAKSLAGGEFGVDHKRAEEIENELVEVTASSAKWAAQLSESREGTMKISVGSLRNYPRWIAPLAFFAIASVTVLGVALMYAK